jgi:hypothetical protein
VVGATRTVASPENETRPTFSGWGMRSTNEDAAVCAAAMRVGETSVACIESDTSMATMIVARSRGTRVTRVGLATATTRLARASRSAAAGTCRRQPGRAGATLSSSARLVKRTAYFFRRPCTIT